MNILELAILKKMVGGGGGSGTDNYNDLSNLPQINGETLAGNKTAENLGLQDALTFDSAPTEDSTNPVESGGVYNALAGKQDNLTFDDDPTENSTNPVKSGGVYSALAGKQDNLTFDGVYNASTNKAATESTVTNAIAGLDVSAFSVDADETISSISETDGKINVTKQDIAIASNQVTAMTGYTKPSSAPATPAIQTSDTANQAFGKLEFKADTNQTNILYTMDHGAKNLFNMYKWMNECSVVGGNKSVDSTYTLTLGATSSNCYTEYEGNTYPSDVEIYVQPNEQYVMTWGYSRVGGSGRGTVYVVFVGSTGETTVSVSAEVKKIEFTTPAGTYGLRVYIKQTTSGLYESYAYMMICSKVVWDTLGSGYQPPSVPNYDLTRLEAEDRAGLIEEIDSGAKNKLKYDLTSLKSINTYGSWDGNVYTYNGMTFTIGNDGSVTIKGTANTITEFNIISRISSGFTLPTGNYVIYGNFATKAGFDMAINRTVSGSSVRYATDNGTGAAFTVTDASAATGVWLEIGQGTEFGNSGYKVYPMVCTKAAFGVSPKFVPFGNDPFYQVPINHNMIYRGRNLGASLTDAQHTALSSGNFTDLYLGDYWTKTVTIPAGTYTGGDGQEVTVPAQTNITLKAVIADFDTFYAGYASSYAGINTHHAAVIVTGFSNVVWNKTNSTAGGYVASLIHKWLVGSALPQIETWFGSAKVLSHQKLLTNAITGDAASGWAWSSQKISLLSENQMYGSKVWGNSKAANGGYEPGEAFKHLNVFNHIDANLLFGNKNILLRDIASAVRAARLSDGGDAYGIDASDARLAPAALILLS